MPGINSPVSSPKIPLATYRMSSGATVSMPADETGEYASMRAEQLNSLLHIITGEGGTTFRLHSESMQENVLWLACTLADEIACLIPLVDSAHTVKGGK